jgi:cellulose synthase (UDP-forming)
MPAYPYKPGLLVRAFRILAFGCATLLLLQFISLYLSWPQQLILGCLSVVTGLVANKVSSSRVITLALMLISMAATLRYCWWRIRLLVDYFSDESNVRLSLDSAFMLLLISAEAYTVAIMFLGYMQTAWPLHRRPILLPNDEDSWPHVDVLIPTYNEPLSLVRFTALAAINIDYPPEKLHVYILDDGTRDEFMEFSREAGVGYISRVEHSHAKAGNINHALTRMNSAYVAIFDCDHVPTRSFLQITLGWMLADSQLGMLQTPHHFYSPDPFERNLLQYKTIPNEGELFYGIVQDGNDFWNATFFCGSCALLRRSALDAVGGIATETVTEDAHTSLRMQKRGYNTAYINIPQAAGLATETLSAHIGQRIRWARGMIQILRTENPLFARGLKVAQRLCYFNAMAHFLYAVPRLVFLCAPLVYLLLGRAIIPGYWVAILVYAFPHLILASLTNSRIQGRHRHSFWNEIYETVLAPYILVPTLLAFINPRLGKFNVTGKGSTLAQTQYDKKIAAPTKWLLLLNCIGLLAVPYRLLVAPPDHRGAIVMNLVWVLFNMVILGVAAAVAYEQKQRRVSVRIETRIPIRAELADGRCMDGITLDMSAGGASISLCEAPGLSIGDNFKLQFPEHCGDEEITARVVGGKGSALRLSFPLSTLSEQETMTRALYSRADAWIDSVRTKEVDRPLVSFWRVFRLSTFGIYQAVASLLPERSPSVEPQRTAKAAVILLILLLGLQGSAQGVGSSVGTTREGTRQTAVEPQAMASGVGKGPVAPDVATLSEALDLKDMGVVNPIEMHGPHSYSSVHFTLSHLLVPKSATLRLIYGGDASLDARTTSLRIILNGIAISTLAPPSGKKDEAATVVVPIPENLLVRNNTLTFEFLGSGLMQPDEQARARVRLRISPASTLTVAGDRLDWKNGLSQLPLPIFDGELQSTTVVPFVFLSRPSPKVLQAAGIVASWLGAQAKGKPVRLATSIGEIPAGNAIVFSDHPSELPEVLHLAAAGEGVLALRVNPSDAHGNVLVLAGGDDEQVVNVARALAMPGNAATPASAGNAAMGGDTMQIPPAAMPSPRANDDAPRWLPMSRVAPLSGCQSQDALKSDGTGPIPLYFHLPPDLYFGDTQHIRMRIHYRFNSSLIASGSALRVRVNGMLESEVPLLPGAGFNEGERSITVPVEDLRPFGNTVLFNFDFIPVVRQMVPDEEAMELEGQILCNSSIDLHGLGLWASMPNLELFANAGFPFTRKADLAETTVVLPMEPSPQEISLFLHLMSHFGAVTGYPALRFTLAGPDAVIGKERDYLILGTIANQPAFASLAQVAPLAFDAQGIHLKEDEGYLSRLRSIEWTTEDRFFGLIGSRPAVRFPQGGSAMPEGLIEGFESPASPGRSIVFVALKQDSSVDAFADAFLDRSQSGQIHGSASLFHNPEFTSYSLDGPTFHVGALSRFAILRNWFTRHFLLLFFAVTLLSLVLGRWAYGWMNWRARERLELAETEIGDIELRP